MKKKSLQNAPGLAISKRQGVGPGGIMPEANLFKNGSLEQGIETVPVAPDPVKKRKSARASGNRFQDRCAKFLEKQGWTVYSQKPMAKQIDTPRGKIWVSKKNDVFNCLDILARKEGCLPLGVQSTLHTGVTEKLKKLIKIPWNLVHEDIQVWMGREDGSIQIKTLIGDSETRLLIDTGKIIRGKLYSLEDKP